MSRYPQSRSILVNIRNDKAKQLIGNGTKEDVHLFHVIGRINIILDEGRNTAELFQALDLAHPDEAQEYWSDAVDEVYDAKLYKLAGKYVDIEKIQCLEERL